MLSAILIFGKTSHFSDVYHRKSDSPHFLKKNEILPTLLSQNAHIMTFPHLLLEMLLYREFSAAHYAQRAQTIRPMAALLRKKIFSCETQNVMFAFPSSRP